MGKVKNWIVAHLPKALREKRSEKHIKNLVAAEIKKQPEKDSTKLYASAATVDKMVEKIPETEETKEAKDEVSSIDTEKAEEKEELNVEENSKIAEKEQFSKTPDEPKEEIEQEVYEEVTKKMEPEAIKEVTKKIEPEVDEEVTKKIEPETDEEVTKKIEEEPERENEFPKPSYLTKEFPLPPGGRRRTVSEDLAILVETAQMIEEEMEQRKAAHRQS